MNQKTIIKITNCSNSTSFSFVEEVVGSRNSEEYALSMELASVGSSTILALKVTIILYALDSDRTILIPFVGGNTGR
jgi:hypothetical protein